MEITFGGQRVNKVMKGKECFSIPVPKENLQLWLDAKNKKNYCETNYKWLDISGHDNIVNLNNFDFDYNNGWDENALHFDRKKTFLTCELNQYDNSCFVMSYYLFDGDELMFSIPGIYAMYSEKGNLILESKVGQLTTIKSKIKYNEFSQLLINIQSNNIYIYLNAELIYDTKYFNKDKKQNILCIGKVEEEFRSMYLHSIQYYSFVQLKENIEKLYRLESDRYFMYSPRDLILDIRGYDRLINHGGDVAFYDHSLRENHLITDNLKFHNRNRGYYSFTGEQGLFKEQRPFFDDSFSFEIGLHPDKISILKNIFIIGKGFLNKYGIQFGMCLNGLIIRFNHSEEESVDYIYKTRTFRKFRVAVTYDRIKKELVLYINGNHAVTYKDAVLQLNNDDMSIFVAKPKLETDLWDNYFGKMYYLRMYRRVLSPEEIENNDKLDCKIYKMEG